MAIPERLARVCRRWVHKLRVHTFVFEIAQLNRRRRDEVRGRDRIGDRDPHRAPPEASMLHDRLGKEDNGDQTREWNMERESPKLATAIGQTQLATRKGVLHG